MNTELYKADIEETLDWCENKYNQLFAADFQEMKNMSKRLQSASKPITDAELQWILVELPMHLFNVSEQLNQFKTALEVVKVKMKEQEADIMKRSTAKTLALKKSEVEQAQYEAKINCILYQSIIFRVESEISLSKELIMGAKKIWDARRKTETANPVSFPNGIPEYKTPIFGGAE